jgi:hypothetical protein
MLNVRDVMTRSGEVRYRTAEALPATEAAVDADPNLSREAFQAVQDAHLAICILKTEV